MTREALAAKCLVDGPVESGKNGKAFLAMVNARPAGADEGKPRGWPVVTKVVKKHLPDGYEFNVFEAQSNSCKFIQVAQTLFSGSLMGKERNKKTLVVGKKVRKLKKGRPSRRQVAGGARKRPAAAMS